MAHFTITSEQFPDHAYNQSAIVWHDPSHNTLCLLAVETPTFRGEKRDEQRKSVFLNFDLASAEQLLAELTEAVEAHRANSFAESFPI